MGAGYGDVDGDGQIDIYLANGGPIMSRFEPDALFLRNHDSYIEVGEQAGVANQGKWAWGRFCRLRSRRRLRCLC